MIRKLAIAAALLATMQAGSAQAIFIPGAAQWVGMGASHQKSYTMAMLNQSMGNGASVQSRGLRQCSKRLRLNGSRIAKAMSAYYKANPARSNRSPSFVFEVAVVKGMCMKDINAARSTRGLIPLKSPK